MMAACAASSFNAALLTAFAMFALLLAVIGIYGVMAYAVHQRVHEVGVRMTIGAKPTDVLWLILSHGLVLAGIGLTFGVGASFALLH
jgi:putative ABC transport system permease protein